MPGSPAEGRARLDAALAARANGDAERAVALCGALLGDHPDYVAALRLMVELSADRGDAREAAAHLGHAFRLDPFEPGVGAALARAYLDLDAPELAMRTAQEALALAPADATIHALLGEAYRLDREYELAADSFSQALRLDPKSVSAAHGLARCQIQLGRLETAADVLNRLVGQGCEQADVLLTLCRLPANLVTVDLLAAVDRGVATHRADDRGRRQFLRATALHLKGRHAEAWQHLLEANQAVFARTRAAYEASVPSRAAILRAVSQLPPAAVDARGSASGLPLPLLILGPPRSGKSTLEALLARTEGVKRGFESPVVRSAVHRAFHAAGWPVADHLDELPAEHDGLFGVKFRDEVARRAGDARVFTSNTYGVLRSVARLSRAVPEARFVFVRRDTHDQTYAIFSQHYGLNLNYAYDLAAIREFADWYAAMGEALSHHLPGRVLMLDYEAIVTRSTESVAAVSALCGVPFSPPSGPVGNDIGVSAPYRRGLG